MNLDLSQETEAFRRSRSDLIGRYGPVWVVFVGEDCVGHFRSFESAAEFALQRYADHPFMIQHTDDPPLKIPLVAIAE